MKSAVARKVSRRPRECARRRLWKPSVTLLALFTLGAETPGPPAVPADHAERMTRGQDVFKKHVRQLLLDSCFKCHGGEKTRGGLDLSTREALLKGGDHGAVIAATGAASKLYRLAAHAELPHMPPKAPRVAGEQLARLAAWIDLGAPYDKPLAEKAGAKKPMVVTDEDRRFWSFRPLSRQTPPEVDKGAEVRTPVDRFVLAKLREKAIGPNPPLDRRRLIRRATFDLTGLPPTPEEIEAFVSDPDPAAYDKFLDRLLAGPAYGERWARHWLDLVRFAESHGFEHDYDRPTAYHYRDFVIKALNADMPYDRFVRLQLAGDELEPDNPLALTATGFLAAGVHSTQITANQVEKERYDELDDIVRTCGTAMLGLTVGCARCHDHKFDPIPTRDYYRLLATFTTTVRSEMDLELDPNAARLAREKFEADRREFTAALARYEKSELPAAFDRWLAAWRDDAGGPALQLAALAERCMRFGGLSPARDAAPLVDSLVGRCALTVGDRAGLLASYKLCDPGWLTLKVRLERHVRAGPRKTATKALISSEGVPAVRLHTQGADFLQDTFFLKRGDPNQKDGIATQGFLQVLTRSPLGSDHWKTPPPPGWRTSYRRRALAAWMTDTDGGAGALLARVIVNRLWQHHFGRGIVATPSDFGYQGERPSHPELLDWLAGELVANGWRLKPIHKLIMRSAVYQQGIEHDTARAAADPDNRLLWRQTPRRLEAEAIRDAMLAVSGTLDRTLYGPGTLDPNMKRRSIYFFVKRSQLMPAMVLFDAPDGLQGIEQRTTTTVAPQALLLMNNAAVRACAEAFARLAGESNRAPQECVRIAYLRALGRAPGESESTDAVRFLATQAQAYRTDGKADCEHLALADLCQALLASNEFAYVD